MSTGFPSWSSSECAEADAGGEGRCATRPRSDKKERWCVCKGIRQHPTRNRYWKCIIIFIAHFTRTNGTLSCDDACWDRTHPGRRDGRARAGTSPRPRTVVRLSGSARGESGRRWDQRWQRPNRAAERRFHGQRDGHHFTKGSSATPAALNYPLGSLTHSLGSCLHPHEFQLCSCSHSDVRSFRHTSNSRKKICA